MPARQPPTFPKTCRLSDAAEFKAVYDRRLKVSDRLLLIFGLPRGDGPARIGLSVSKKQHGKQAVRRNRVKRLLREAFRLTRHEFPPGWDYVVIPRPAAETTLEDYQRSLRRLTRKLAERHAAEDR
ncbi:MAG: ribonuclease P protein component [Planctomycetota bacterium]